MAEILRHDTAASHRSYWTQLQMLGSPSSPYVSSRARAASLSPYLGRRSEQVNEEPRGEGKGRPRHLCYVVAARLPEKLPGQDLLRGLRVPPSAAGCAGCLPLVELARYFRSRLEDTSAARLRHTRRVGRCLIRPE